MVQWAVILVVAAVLATACAGGSGGDNGDGGEVVGTATTTSAPDPSTTALPGYFSPTYTELDAWVCHPDDPTDPCTTADLATTSINADGVQATSDVAAGDPAVDCIYLSPAGEGSGPPADEWARIEIARFRDRCRIFSPTFDPNSPDGGLTDVLDAFDHYLAQESDGRPFVFVGHGRGADLLTAVLQQRVDQNPGLLTRFVSAILVGASGVFVPRGEVVGGTFATIPLCTASDQPGCVVAYNAYASGTTPTIDNVLFGGLPDGMSVACTSPTDLGGGRGQFRDSVFATASTLDPPPTVGGLPEVATPFIAYPEFYVGQCVDFGNGVRYLAVEGTIDPTDIRPVGERSNPVMDEARLGLFLLDIEIAMGDLLRMVELQSAGFS